MSDIVSVAGFAPFFVLMGLFALAGHLAASVVPPYRRLVPQLLTKKGYYIELESLRGILALSVVVHHSVCWYFFLQRHAWETNGSNFYAQLGTLPVTLFFFLTGFLFWSKLMNGPRPAIGPFVYGRLRRLGPAYLASAVFLFVLVAIFTHLRVNDSAARIVAGAARWVTFTIAGTPDLNGLKDTHYLWVVTWTLKLEVVFYLMIPFVSWFARAAWKSLLFIACSTVLYALTLVINPDRWHIPSFFLIQAFLFYLSFTFSGGIIAAHLARLPAVRKFAQSNWAILLSAAAISITLLFASPSHGPVESLLLIVPFITMACGNSLWGALRSRSLLFLGQISYSVYLVHCLVLASVLIPLHKLAPGAMSNPFAYWAIAALAGILVIAVATVWHRLFEMPFMGKRRPAADPGAATATATPAAAAPVAVGSDA